MIFLVWYRLYYVGVLKNNEVCEKDRAIYRYRFIDSYCICGELHFSSVFFIILVFVRKLMFFSRAGGAVWQQDWLIHREPCSVLITPSPSLKQLNPLHFHSIKTYWRFWKTYKDISILSSVSKPRTRTPPPRTTGLVSQNNKSNVSWELV